MVQILLIEDDTRIAAFLQKGLSEQLYQVRTAATGAAGISEAAEYPFDLIILDIMLPDMDGFAVCQLLRRRKNLTPVIILSALDSPEEKVKGLQCGADDYLGKPFLFEELLARIQAQLRRADFSKGISEYQRYAGVVINVDEQSAARDGKDLALSPLEYKLLLFFMRNREKALSRTVIAQAVWNIQFDASTNTVDVYINFLRKKLDKGFSQPLLHTIKGTGYMLKQKVDETQE
jgi:two-component system copper resistance phosphate regulon response regulator CusR